MKKTTIYIATHKSFFPPLHFIYKPIISGSVQQNFCYLKDNKGKNISNKNPFYAELTVLYWIWKNDNSKYVGLTHYHRYFAKEKLIGRKEIQSILENFDVIVPTPIYLEPNIKEQYASVHYKDDFYLACQEIIKRDRTYKQAVEETLNEQKFYAYNMFIAQKAFLDKYASFLFPILFFLEKQIPYLNYSDYNQRVFGFIAERIFNIYLKRQNILIYEYPVRDTLSLQEQELKRMRILKSISIDNENGRKK